ncbi:MAG: DUF5693 family protein [Moorellales bacterium]
MWALILLAVFLSTVVAGFRWQAEAANRTVFLLFDYQQVDAVCRYTGLARQDFLARLKDAGVGAVLVKEPRLFSLDQEPPWNRGPVRLCTGAELSAELGKRNLAGSELDPQKTYFLTPDVQLAEQIREQLAVKVPHLATRLLEANGQWAVETPLARAQLQQLNLGLGFDLFPWEEVAAAGLKVVPQLRPWVAGDADSVREAVQALAPYRDRIALILFDEDRVVGYPRYVPVLAQTLRSLDLPVGMIEFTEQKGLATVVRLVGKRALRVHSLTPEEMKSYTPTRALDRFLLAAAERNHRVLVVRFFLPGEAGISATDLLERNLAYLVSLRKGLMAQGLIPGEAKPFTPFPLPRLLFFGVGLGAWAAAVLLLEALGLSRRALWGLGLAGLAGYVLLWADNSVLARQAAALVAAVSLPVLGVLRYQKAPPQGPGVALARFGLSTVISLAGAAMVVGLLGEVGFMLSLDKFLGTKVAHLAPPLLVGWALWWSFHGGGGSRKQLSSPVTWWQLGGLAVLLGVAYIYTVRTGNEGVNLVFGWEREFRRWLDAMLVVRPRTKEFLLGHPALLLGYYVGHRRYRALLWVAGAIGQASIVNTFAHVHTPLTVALLRVANGLWLGLALGLVAIVVWRWYQRAAGGCRSKKVRAV